MYRPTHAPLTQLADVAGLDPVCSEFESLEVHQLYSPVVQWIERRITNPKVIGLTKLLGTILNNTDVRCWPEGRSTGMY